MKTKKGRTKQRIGARGLAAVFVVAAMTGCGGGSGSFVDQNGTQIVGRGEPSEDLRRAVARIITDPAQEVQATTDELGAFRTVAPLFREAAPGEGTGPLYDKALGLYVERSVTGPSQFSQLFEDAALQEKVGSCNGRLDGPNARFSSLFSSGLSISRGVYAQTSGGSQWEKRSDETFSFQYGYQLKRSRGAGRTSPAVPMLEISANGTAERDRAGRTEFKSTTSQMQTPGGTTVTSTSRVIRRLDRSGERRGTYKFNGDTISVSVTYGLGGTGTGTLTGSANGLPATIAVGERITSVKYADEKTIETFDRPQFTAEFFK